jgi:hypothetical protein
MEEWKDTEYPNYEVSNYGNVRRKGANKCMILRIVKEYYKVYLSLGSNSNRKNVSVHRLVAKAFLPNPTDLPCVDHINTNPLDNNIQNLRWCSFSQNAANLKSRSISGLKGTWKKGNKWMSKIMCNGTVYWLGTFSTPEEANEAYKAKAIELFGEFARW